MPDYQFNEVIDFNVSGGTAAETLSGFTNDLTKFTFSVNTGTLPAFITKDRFVVDFGDGNNTSMTSTTADHVYMWPGIYTVTLIGYSSAGEPYQSTVTKVITASDFIPDELRRDSPSTYGTVIIKAGDKNNQIKIDRFSTYQNYPSLSASGYTLLIDVSGSGSTNFNRKELFKQKWGHTSNTWSIFSRTTADNGTINYTQIDSVTGTNELIYYKKSGASYVRSLSTDAGSVFVGTSGGFDFYFKDDFPKARDSFVPVVVYAGLDTGSHPSPESISNGDLSTSSSKYSFGQSKLVTVPFSVRFSPGTKLSMTPAGIQDIPFPTQKWERTQTPFVISILDSNNQTILNYPSLTLSSVDVSVYDGLSSSDLVLNEIYFSLFETDSTTLSSSVHSMTDGETPASINGLYRGFFVPYASTTSAVTARYKVKVNNESFFDDDITFGLIGRAVAISGDNTQSPIHLVPRVEVKTNINTGSEVINTGQINSFSVSALSAEQFATAVAPESGSSDRRGYIGDVKNDLIHIVNQNAVTFKNPYNLRNITVLGTPSQDLLTYSNNNLSANDNTINRLGITSLSIDSEFNLWMSLYDANLVARINYSTDEVDRLLIGRDGSSATTYDVTEYTSNPNLSGFGGYNIEEPYAIDADKNNDVWVSYTNPLSSSLKHYTVNRYVNTMTLNKEVVLDPGTSVTDIAVDADNNLWFGTYQQVRNSNLYTDALTATVDTDNSRFRFQAPTSLLPTVSALIEPGRLFIVRGYFYGAKPFNGGYIIDTVSSDRSTWTVKTHPDDYMATTSSTSGEYSVQFEFADSDYIGKVTSDSTDTVVTKISGFYNPSHITFDNSKNIWFTHDVSTVEEISYATNTADRRWVLCKPGAVVTGPIDYETKQYLTGLASDFNNRLWVINSHQKVIHFVPTNAISLSSQGIIPNAVDNEYYQSFGDWTGYRWFNKYLNLGSTGTLSGITTFTVNPTGGIYDIRKIAEDYDPSETIKSYRQQDFLKNYNKLFDDLIGGIVGDGDSDPNVLGKKIYEKISNFTGNHSDVLTCNVDKLISLAKLVGHKIDNHNYAYPSGIKRLVDVLSIPHSKLWGMTSKFDRDFDTQNTDLDTLGVNLGSLLDVNSYVVTAGTPIIVNQLYNNEYRSINTMQVSLTPDLTANSVLDSSTGLYSQYPLSAYKSDWGWGLNPSVSGVDINIYYNFYGFIEKYNDTVLDNVIDWDNSQTTLLRANSAIAVWEADQSGVIDLILDQQLREGLGLFQDSISATST